MPLYFIRNVNKSGRRGVVVKACSSVKTVRSSIPSHSLQFFVNSLIQQQVITSPSHIGGTQGDHSGDTSDNEQQVRLVILHNFYLSIEKAC